MKLNQHLALLSKKYSLNRKYAAKEQKVMTKMFTGKTVTNVTMPTSEILSAIPVDKSGFKSCTMS